MFFINRFLVLAVLCLVVVQAATAANYVLGIGAAVDTEDAIAITAFGDLELREDTWLSASVGSTETEALVSGFETRFYDFGIDHFLDPIGLRLSGAYWGDSDILDSSDVRASVYFRDEIASFSVDYERRNFDFVFTNPFTDERRQATFHAEGWGMTNRVQLHDSFSVRLSGMQYEYSRRINLEPNIDVLRFLSASRLSLMNSLIDYRISAGMEYRFGLRAIDLSLGTWKTAVDQGKVDSISLGFLTPLSDRTDVEMRLSFDDSENFGRTTAFTVYLYYFGGN
ncbi:MAG: hypothetical protein R3192_01935 [Woeseiaceae bacterium]|nr:hypothetical protein [Woeseiaceae bacterium]